MTLDEALVAEQLASVLAERKGKSRMSLLHRLKISIANSHPLSDEHKAKLAAAKLGKQRGPHSEETKRKISEAAKGRVPAIKGKKLSKEARRNMRKAARKREAEKRRARKWSGEE